MLAPSKATPKGSFPTAKVPSVVPSLARRLVTLLLPAFVTQMLAPSKAAPLGPVPAVKVPRVIPSLARSLVTVLLKLFATQMLAPSKAMPSGCFPTGKVPSSVPSLARNFITLLELLPAFVTQMLAPSKAASKVKPPAGNCVGTWLALYQCRRAICPGFLAELTTCAEAGRGTIPRRPATTMGTIKYWAKSDFPKIIEICLHLTLYNLFIPPPPHSRDAVFSCIFCLFGP